MNPTRIFARALVILTVLTLLAPLPARADGQVPQIPSNSRSLAPGVDYTVYRLRSDTIGDLNISTPNNIFVVKMSKYAEPSNNILETAIAQGRLSEGDSFETVQNMAARYEGAINYWGQQWGGTDHVLAAINGYYHLNNDSQLPRQGVIHSGWYASRYDDLQSKSGFFWNFNRQIQIGECINHTPEENIVTFHADSPPDSGLRVTQVISDVNTPRHDDALYLYTPQWDITTGTDNSGVEVLVEVTRPTLILKQPYMVLGTIKKVRDGRGSTRIPFDHIVLSATGSAADILRAQAQEGEQIGISQHIQNCPISTYKPDWTKAYAGLGGDYFFLRDGTVITEYSSTDAIVRQPRTAIAYNDQDLFLIVADGFDPSFSVGVTVVDLATFAKEVLGATFGITLDSGGSSTMVVNGEIVNNTYCNIYRCEENRPPLFRKYYLPLATVNRGSTSQGNVTTSAEPPLPRPFIQTDLRDSDIAELEPGDSPVSPGPLGTDLVSRLVPDALMLVASQPITASTTLTDHQSVSAPNGAIVYQGPGKNYGIFGSVDAGKEGVVLPHERNLNGVFATGSFWWKVDFGGGLVGWVPEEALQ